MRGRAFSNCRHNSLSGRRCASPMGAKVRKIARSPKSARLTMFLDAVQEDRAARLKQHLLVVRVELPYGEAAAARKPAKAVREPNGQAGQIIECEQIAIVGCNH